MNVKKIQRKGKKNSRSIYITHPLFHWSVCAASEIEDQVSNVIARWCFPLELGKNNKQWSVDRGTK